MDPELQQYLQAMETRIVDTLTERMRDMQTETLKAFEPWQENIHARTRLLERTWAAIDDTAKARMDTIERRLAEIEKKLLLNPPAA